jgi:hypothetical protein
MAGQPQPPVLIKSLPFVITYEGAAYGPLDLNRYIKSPNEDSGEVRFSAQLLDGRGLPQGLICTEDGLITGILAEGTAGEYEYSIVAENNADVSFTLTSTIIIKTQLSIEDPEFLTSLKSQVWQALGSNMPVPEIADLINRPVTATEIYYLLQRFGVLTVWDVMNLEVPGAKVDLQLPGTSPHYAIYDRGSCLIAAPKDLFSHARTLEDALQTSRVLARELYKRNWSIEFAGFNKMVRAAWVELQHLGDQHGRKLNIAHYQPTQEDLRTYVTENQMKPPRP